jgi:hypothetical protein
MLSIDIEFSSSRERRILKDREVLALIPRGVLCCSSATAHAAQSRKAYGARDAPAQPHRALACARGASMRKLDYRNLRG